MADTQLTPASAPAQSSISSDFTEISDLDQESHRLTVSYGPRSVRGPDGRSMLVPLLRLQGAWLQRAGFATGVPVRVRVSAGRLVIEVANNPERVRVD